jgi:hypothetical protein
MFRNPIIVAAAIAVGLVTGVNRAEAGRSAASLAVTMTNDPMANQIKVYDADSGALLQTLSTHGKGGVGGNARGVKQFGDAVLAVVNNGSGDVALFQRVGDRLRFDKLVRTTSAPVSIDFGNDHMYVAGSTSVDSFAMYHDSVAFIDGSAALELATGGAPPAGSTAQVGVISDRRLLVTLKADPDPGTVDVVRLRDGAISGTAPTAVPGPAGSLTPFGFAVYRDGTAVITLAHTSQDGLFRDGAFTAVIDAGQLAPCWMTRAGKYVFTANTASQTLSRLIGTGSNVFVDKAAAAAIPTGAPSDIDAAERLVGVIDHGAGQSHLSLFLLNEFGELTAKGAAINLGTANANGLALLVPHQD